jgi:LuxR family maltose regulon positive regulatory protein
MDEAERVTRQMRAHLRNLNNTFAKVIMEVFQIELALRQGHLTKARRLSYGTDFSHRPPIWLFYTPQLVPIKLLIAEGSPAEALVQLEALDAQMLPLHRNNVRIDILALQALVYDTLGQEEAAFSKISEALSLSAAGGHIRNFVDLGPPMAALLARFQEQQNADQIIILRHIERIRASFVSDSPLTDRETEILSLLASEQSAQEIADALTISKTTLHTHTKNIYKKLGAHSRFEAVQRAKEKRLPQ